MQSIPLTTSITQVPYQQRGVSFNFSHKTALTAVFNSSLIIKILSIGILIGYLISFTSLNEYLCIIPGKLLPPNFWLWTLATHSFIETSIFQVITDLILIFLYTKMLEPLWGTKECLIFYAVCTISVGICTCFVYLAIFAINFQEKLIFNTKICGLASLIGGFSVAIKQIMPDTVILAIGILRLKQDDIPLLLVLASIIFELIGLVEKTYFIQILFGIFTSWIYLRFYQKHKNGSRGDQSSAFSFASFFPTLIRPIISILSNTIFDILVRIKICKKPPKRYNVGAPSTITISIPGSGIDINNDAAERRRQKALKALNERLKKPDNDVKWTEDTQQQQQTQQEISQNQEEDNSNPQILINIDETIENKNTDQNNS